jgi:alanine racemase
MSTTGTVTIDLGAIADNWRFLDAYIGSTNVCGAVVKADAYGLGVEPVATSLRNVGCRLFFVATLLEAKELRSYLPAVCEIVVLGGLSHDVGGDCSQDWKDYRLTPVLFTVEHVVRWLAFCSNVESCLPSAIKVDTGMHRLGVQPAELQGLLDSGTLKALNPRYMMSHFACADQPEHSLNSRQISCFEACVQKVKEQVPAVKLSLCNSSGIFLDSNTHRDVVRPGIALYGANPTPASDNPMTPVVQVRLPIMQCKVISEGECVGYGAEFIAQRETVIAIVFGGYADGLMRSLAHSGFAFLSGHKIPLIGRLSMDSMVFDITDLSPLLIDSASCVEVVGDNQSIDDLAAMSGTIAYEILTSLGSRYHRRYINMPIDGESTP